MIHENIYFLQLFKSADRRTQFALSQTSSPILHLVQISNDSNNNKNLFLLLESVYVCVCVQFIIKKRDTSVADLSSGILRGQIYNHPKAKTNCQVASYAKSPNICSFSIPSRVSVPYFKSVYQIYIAVMFGRACISDEYFLLRFHLSFFFLFHCFCPYCSCKRLLLRQFSLSVSFFALNNTRKALYMDGLAQ